MDTLRPPLTGLVMKSVVLHSLTYFLAGWMAYNVFEYAGLFAIPSLAGFMRPTDSLWVLVGPLFQPLRGMLFGLALFPLQNSLFNQPVSDSIFQP